jgi:very-short-patch-repair endonuclease
VSGRQTPLPSPLAGEGGERSEPGEGAGRLRVTSRPTRRARSLRAQMTDAERRLWFDLRDRCFADFKFRRQVPVGPFFADFICFDARLVVEVDGGQHADSKRDQQRDRWLEANGFRVIRFWNNDVLKNREGVLTLLLEALRVRHPSPGAPIGAPPSPARGEGSEFAAAKGAHHER